MHKDALVDSVTISTVAKTKDSIGQEKKTATVLYSNVPCRLMEDNKGRSEQNGVGSFEKFKNIWLLQMGAQYNGASRGDRAVVNSQTYLITKKQEIRGASPKIEYVVYSLEEQE